MKRFATIIFLLGFFISGAKAQQDSALITLDASNIQYRIDKNIYGQFSEHLGHGIYGGIWVGTHSSIPNIDGMRKDVIEALKKIDVPVLRWPGGCFADEYHWKDGIGPRDKRPKMVNTNWGDVTEDNAFGTSEYLEFCKLIGCQPYITGNLGSGTVQELSQWVEYVNSDNVSPMTELRKKYGRAKPWGVKYWGLGNESWGCGGNMTPEYYANLARRYGTFMRTYGKYRPFKIACGPGGDDYNWTNVVMKDAGNYIDGLSLHYYSFANDKTAADFNESGWFDIMNKTLMMEELIKKNSAIMDKYDPGKRVALVVDEWGTWYKVEPGTNPAFLYQQNTMRDAVAAACNLNIFNNNCDRVRMANIAQTVNVLQSMILTDGPKMVCTPTYYVFDLYKVHQNAMLIPSSVETPPYVFKGDSLPAVNCSASINAGGIMNVSLCNIDPDSSESVDLDMKSFTVRGGTGKVLTASKMNAHNTFDDPNAVVPHSFSDFKVTDGKVEVNMPPMSVVVLALTGKLQAPPPIELNNPQPGLNFDYYEGAWSFLPNFDELAPQAKGIASTIAIPAKNSGENFGVQYTGYIKILKDGVYTFSLNSDDGSCLYIDNKTVVSNDGQHAPEERSGVIMLNEGYHKVKVTFFQRGGGMTLEAYIAGPGLAKQAIPSDMLFREGK